jgi:hypothetical protein
MKNAFKKKDMHIFGAWTCTILAVVETWLSTTTVLYVQSLILTVLFCMPSRNPNEFTPSWQYIECPLSTTSDVI